MNILFEFVMAERFEYADVNVFSHNLGQALRYYDFLLIILGRYEEANEKIVLLREEERKLLSTQTGIRRVMPREVRRLEESSRLTTLLHLEVESFYLFAKVLLDNIARFLNVYFGEERGIRIKSHNDLAKRHEKYFEAKGLVIPRGISESIIFLKEGICDYRDKVISHEKPLGGMKATMWGASGNARIVGGRVFPQAGERKTVTMELPQLMEDINSYLQKVIVLIESNRAKTKLELRDKASYDI